jgi:hypothetical protein
MLAPCLPKRTPDIEEDTLTPQTAEREGPRSGKARRPEQAQPHFWFDLTRSSSDSPVRLLKTLSDVRKWPERPGARTFWPSVLLIGLVRRVLSADCVRRAFKDLSALGVRPAIPITALDSNAGISQKG